MRIGIDIDGVLTDIERFQLDYGSKYWFEKNIGEIINPSSYRVFELFGNNKELNEQFWNDHRKIYGINVKAREFASEVIKKLKEQGNEIYIITARYFTDENSDKGEETRLIVKEWLENNEIVYDRLIFSGENKLQICIDNKIDLMIDDSVENVNNISTAIPVICFDASYNRECNGKNIIRCYSWYDIYSKIIKIEK